MPPNTGPMKTCNPLKPDGQCVPPQMLAQPGLAKGFRAAEQIFRISVYNEENLSKSYVGKKCHFNQDRELK